MDEFKSMGREEEYDPALETMLEYLRGVQKASEGKTVVSVPNVERVKKFLQCYNIVKTAMKGQRVKVSYVIEDPPSSFGYVQLEGKKIRFNNPEDYIRAAEYSSNSEVYPKIDGSVVMSFGFYGLRKRLS